jgi:hypothetical protein
MRPTTMIAGLATACLVCACAPALDWRELRPEGSGIVALFPCKPEKNVRTLAVAGHRVRMAMLACSAAGATYALAYADLPDPAAIGPALAELRGLAAANIGAAPGVTAALQVPGMTPHPQAGLVVLSGRLPDGAPVQEQAVFFARGLRVYQAGVIGARLEGDGAQTFLAALKLAA